MTGGAAAEVELVPLAERANVLQTFRLAMVAAVLVSTTLAADTVGAPVGAVAQVTAGYALFTVAAEATRRALRRRCLDLIGAMLLADGVWIAAVVTRTGGPRSLLAVLAGVHVVAVTLLASYRTGLKIAVWHSLLFVVAHYARSTGVIGGWDPPGSPGPAPVPQSAVVAGVVTFLVLAVATAVFSSLNERELRRSRRGLQGLVALGDQLQDVRSPDGVGPVVLRCLLQSFGVRRAAMVEGDGEEISRVWVADAAGVRTLDLGWAGRRPGQVLLRCWQEREPQLVRTLGPDASVLGTALPDAKNMAVVPMVADGNVVGALVVEHGVGVDAVSGTRVNALTEFAAHAALSLRSATLLAEVERLARVDELSGLPNRRTFDETLEREVARAVRSGEPLSLVMLDVDHFKRINDTWGHHRGDDVIRLLGQTLGTCVRQLDLPARYGGEEFALILPDCTGPQAVRVAEQLRSALSARCGEIPVTASAGVATLPGNAATGAELVAAADEALYASKRAGRDRVTFSDRQAPVAVATGAYRVGCPA